MGSSAAGCGPSHRNCGPSCSLHPRPGLTQPCIFLGSVNEYDRRSSIADWRSLCMLTSIGSTCRSEWNTNSCRWCVTASTRKLLSTWQTAAFQSPMWPVDDISVPPVVITLLCRDTISARTVVGHLLLLARLPGTHWVTICMIRRLALTVSDMHSRLVCFQSTSTSSALEVLHSMRYINLRFTYFTYLLTGYVWEGIRQVCATCLVRAIYLSASVVAVSTWGAVTSARHLHHEGMVAACCLKSVTPSLSQGQMLS